MIDMATAAKILVFKFPSAKTAPGMAISKPLEVSSSASIFTSLAKSAKTNSALVGGAVRSNNNLTERSTAARTSLSRKAARVILRADISSFVTL